MLARPIGTLPFLRRTTLLCARSYHGNFSTKDGRFWNRKLHGTEVFSAAVANVGEGYGHVSIGASVILTPSILSTKLRESVRKAWIRLRYYAPLIALRTRHGEGEDDIFMTYESSKTRDIAAKWADDTITWENEEKILDARDLDLKERWWGSDDHWNMEMHVGPGTQGRLHFMFLTPHWVIDAHLVPPLLDKFFEFLVAEVEGKAQGVDGLKWGDETKRLPPALVEAVADKYRRNVGQSISEAEPPAAFVPSFFSRPAEHVPLTSTSLDYRAVSFPIILTKAETQAFHEECKLHKYNVSPVVNAILVLADVETTLWWGHRRGKDKFDVVKHMFETADLFPVPINAVNRRSALSPEHIDLDSPLGTPGVAADGFPTLHDMNVVRQSIRVSEDGQIQTDMSDKIFWDGVVANAAAVLEPARVIPPTFTTDQARFTPAMSRAIANQAISSRILSSSIGNIDKSGHLSRWRPSAATAESTLVIDRIILSFRLPTPTIGCTCYQYDGQLNLHLQGSSKYHSEEVWQYFGEAVARRVRHISGAATNSPPRVRVRERN